MISTRRWTIAAGAVLLTGAWLAACGGERDERAAADKAQAALERALEEIPPEERPRVERGADGEIRYSGETESGENFEAQLGGDVQIPKSFPADLPLYPDAVPFSAMETGGGTNILSLDSGASAAEVYEFYREQLPAAGWSVDTELTVGSGRVLTAIKDGRKAVLHIEDTEQGSRFGFTTGPAS